MHTDEGLIKLIEDVLAKGKGIQQLNMILCFKEFNQSNKN